MAVQSPPRTPVPPATRADTRTRTAGGVALAVLLLGLVVVAVNARHGAVAERIRNPRVTGAPRPVAPLWGFDHWLVLHQIGTDPHDGHADHRLRGGLAPPPPPPDPADGAGPHPARLAGPDHELGPVRGVQPAALALARDVGIGVALADRRAVHRDRVRHLLLGAVLPRGVAVAPPPGPPIGGRVRLAASARQSLAADPRHRVRVRRHAGDVPRPHPAVHLLPGGPLRIHRRGEVVPVPADLGVGAGHAGDDPRRSPALPRRHRPHPGREARPSDPGLSCPPGARDIPRDVRHHQRRLPLLRRELRRAYAWPKITTSVACPWPFPEAKVYDPNGYYERSGQPGPYFAGIWSGWESGQPNGRPGVVSPADTGRCGNGNG